MSVLSIFTESFQTPHVRGGGLRVLADLKARVDFDWVFQTPHVRGGGLRECSRCPGLRRKKRRSFRPLMFRAGDCERREERQVVGPDGGRVSDPSCSGRGTVSQEISRGTRHATMMEFQTPHVRGGGLRGSSPSAFPAERVPSFRPLMFGAGDCEPMVRGRGQGGGVVSDPSCSGRGTASAVSPTAST